MKDFFKLAAGAIALCYFLVSVVLMVLFVADGNALGLFAIATPPAIYLLLPKKWQFLDRM